MIKKTITYKDYNDNSRTDTFYFNLSKSELVELSAEYGNFSEIANSNDLSKLVPMMKKIILKAYGKKSDDGKRFIKSEELSTEFYQSEAYSSLFMELATNGEESSKFIKGLIPADINVVAPAISMA